MVTYQEPFGSNARACADVLLGRKDKLVVHNPVELGAEDGRGVNKDSLVVLDGAVQLA